MSKQLPPELMAPEERAERAAELEQEIARQWVRFAVVEGVVVWAPLGVLLLIYAMSDAIDDSMLPMIVGIWVALSIGLTVYWLLARIRPRRRELDAVRGGGRWPGTRRGT